MKCKKCGLEAGDHKLCVTCQIQAGKEVLKPISPRFVPGNAKLTITRKNGTTEVR